VFVFYVIGIVSACWHLGNGLFGFAIHWGLATGRSAQRLVGRLAFGVFVVLTLVALNSLLAFTGHGIYPKWITKPHATESLSVVYQGGQR
jgi:succinate dehydrogenase / fumarate reductase cytochrome b subunit